MNPFVARASRVDHPSLGAWGRSVWPPACHAGDSDGGRTRTHRHLCARSQSTWRLSTLNRGKASGTLAGRTTKPLTPEMAGSQPFDLVCVGSIPSGGTTWAWGNSNPPALEAGDSRSVTGRPDHSCSGARRAECPGPQPGESGCESRPEYHFTGPRCYGSMFRRYRKRPGSTPGGPATSCG